MLDIKNRGNRYMRSIVLLCQLPGKSKTILKKLFKKLLP